MPIIILATTNPAKLARLRWLVQDLPLSPLAPTESMVELTVEETGTTHDENARLKAAAWSNAFGGLALATDGGLVIPALGDSWNSVRTSRFAGPDADDRQRTDALLELMQRLSGDERRAYWTEAVALADKGQVLKTWTRSSREGAIADGYGQEQLIQGFWVFTLWWFPKLGKRYVDLTSLELAQVEDHWTGLRGDVREFLAERLG